MRNTETIKTELNEIAPAIAVIQNINVYSVAAAYFINFPGLVLSRIKSGEIGKSTILNEGVKTLPFSAPAGYFDGLAAQIMAKVKSSATSTNEIEQELQDVAPTLVGLRKHSHLYTVPAGYFENLEMTGQKHTAARVVTMSGTRKALLFMAAAVIITVMAISAYLFLGKTPEDNVAVVVPSTSINVNNELNSLSEEEIIEYLKMNTSVDVATFSSYIPDVEADFDEIINELPEEELQEFLKQYSDNGKVHLKNS